MARLAHQSGAPYSKLICYVVFWLAFVLPVCLHAQQYKFDFYDQAQGLKTLQIQDLAFDKLGFLWVATNNGLFRFLGSHFEFYGSENGLLDRDISELYVDPQGRLWVGTQSNIYLRAGDHFSAVGPNVSIDITGRHILALEADRLLALNKGQLLEIRLNKNGAYVSSALVFPAWQRKAQPELNAISSVAKGRDGTLWMSCKSSICSLAEGRLQTWGPSSGVKVYSWRQLYIDKGGAVWALSEDDLVVLRPGTTQFEDMSLPRRAPGRYFPWRALLEDRKGRILINTAGELLRREGAAWKLIGPGNGLNENAITSLIMDPNGDLWMGTLGGVSHWIGYESWESWTARQGLPDSRVWAVNSTDPAEVLIGTVKGPALINTSDNRVRPLTSRHRPWTYGQVSSITKDGQGKLWVGTFSGRLLCIDPQSLSVKPFADLKEIIRGIVELDGKIWAISYNGVTVIDYPESKPAIRHVGEADTLLGGIPDTWSVTRGSRGQNDLWFVSDRGLFRYTSGIWSKPSVSGLNTKWEKLVEIRCAPDGTLWVVGRDAAERVAIWHLKSRGMELEAIPLSIPSGLSEVRPYSLLIDHRGWVWMGSDSGLAGWNGSAWRVFNQEMGLISDNTNRGALSEAPDGGVWVGTPLGASHLSYPERAFDSVPLPIAITNVQSGDTSYMVGMGATLPWSRSSIRFGFASPMTWNRSNLAFSYRLTGLDSKWASTQNTEVSFLGLPPGTYRFQLYANNFGLAARSAIAEFPLKILPPWWRTIWFYGICALSLAWLIWFVHRLRTRQLRLRKQNLECLVQEMSVETVRLAKREQDAAVAEERNRMAHELHDALMGAFTGIFMQLQAASDLAISNGNQSRSCIARAEELSRDGLRRVREFVKSLTIDSDEPAPTPETMKRMVLAATEGTAATAQFVVEGCEKPLKRSHALTLMRIMQEAIGNTQRYAEAKNIIVRVTYEQDSVALSICDDGKGFVLDELDDIGLGLSGMRARAERLSGRYHLQSAPRCGTTISVELPHPFEQELRAE